jgi:hypothetical protein
MKLQRQGVNPTSRRSIDLQQWLSGTRRKRTASCFETLWRFGYLVSRLGMGTSRGGNG